MDLPMTRLRLLLCLQCAMLIASIAIGFQVTPVGPPGGAVDEIVPDLKHPNLWYCISGYKLYRSTDTGNSWTFLKSGLGDVYVNPVSSEVLAITQASDGHTDLMASSDMGNTFSLRYAGLLEKDIFRLRIDSTNASLIFGLDPDSHIFYSVDDGKSWTASALPFQVGDPFPCGEYTCTITQVEPLDLFAPPFQPGTVYAIVDLALDDYFLTGGILLVSRDSGQSFQTVSQSTDDSWEKFFLDPLYPNRAFASTYNGLWELTSTSGWQVLGDFGDIDSLISTPGNPNEFLALSVSRMYRSTDGGKTWSRVASLELNGELISIYRANSGILAATRAGVYVWTPGGGWTPSNAGLGPARVTAVSYDPIHSNLLAAVDDTILDQSSDGGKTWTYRKQGQSHYWIDSVFMDPQNPLHLLINNGNGLVSESLDGGSTWKALYHGYQFEAFDPVDSSVEYFYRGRHLYKRIGNGSLQVLPHVFPYVFFPTVVVDPNDSKTIFAYDSRNLFKSRDGGLSFHMLSSLPPSCEGCHEAAALLPLFTRNSFLALKTSGSFYKTTDAGQTWNFLSRIHAFGEIEARLFLAGASDLHLIGIVNGRLLESVDGGKTWTPIKLGIECNAMTDPRFLPFFVATDRGIYRFDP